MAQFTASTTLRNSMIAAVAGALDDAPMMHGDGGVDQIAAQRPQPRQNPVLVGSGKPRIADDVGHQDRREFARFAHGATPPRPCQPFRVVREASQRRERNVDVFGLGHGALGSRLGRGAGAEAGTESPACRMAVLSAPRAAWS